MTRAYPPSSNQDLVGLDRTMRTVRCARMTPNRYSRRRSATARSLWTTTSAGRAVGAADRMAALATSRCGRVAMGPAYCRGRALQPASMLIPMPLLMDSFWRAMAYCVLPRVLILSLLPLLLMGLGALLLGHFYWDAAVVAVAEWINSSGLMGSLWSWLSSWGAGNLPSVLAPMLVLAVVVPVVVVLSLLVVATMMTPALVGLVAQRRFPELERRKGASFLHSMAWSLASMALALLALFASMPLWLIPPLVLVLPPLIWGWLAYRVMAFDALAEHADPQERVLILKRHRVALLAIGLITGYLGAAPAIVWASGLVFAAAFFVLIPVGIWIYTLVFAFSSLWFAHYCLAALNNLRDTASSPKLPGQAASQSATTA